MADSMEFPKTIEEFLDDYSFKDKENVYTNGSILIPLFKVKQGLEHYMRESKAALEKQIPKKVILGYDEQDSICCPNCKGELMSMDWYDHWKCNYCEVCGQALEWSNVK